jgi:hypothetical protein
MPPAVVDVAMVAGAVIIGAAVWPAMLVSFAVLFAAGAVIGLRGRSERRWLAIGSVVGGLLVYAWVVVREPSASIDGLRNGGSSAVLIGLAMAAALVLPGYLFARASRRSGETPGRSDDSSGAAGRSSAPPEPSARAMVTVACLILAVDLVVVLKFFATPLGP